MKIDLGGGAPNKLPTTRGEELPTTRGRSFQQQRGEQLPTTRGGGAPSNRGQSPQQQESEVATPSLLYIYLFNMYIIHIHSTQNIYNSK